MSPVYELCPMNNGFAKTLNLLRVWDSKMVLPETKTWMDAGKELKGAQV